MEILKELAEKSRWKTECFGGALLIGGRVLSPIEAQAAGMASKTLMMKMMEIVEKEEQPEEEEVEKTILDQINKITPDDLMSFGAMQDRILVQVVDKCSQDGGESWEKLHLVLNEGQQNPSRNALWVGVVQQDDKNKIFELAMTMVKGASPELENFQS